MTFTSLEAVGPVCSSFRLSVSLTGVNLNGSLEFPFLSICVVKATLLMADCDHANTLLGSGLADVKSNESTLLGSGLTKCQIQCKYTA